MRATLMTLAGSKFPAGFIPNCRGWANSSGMHALLYSDLGVKCGL